VVHGTEKACSPFFLIMARESFQSKRERLNRLIAALRTTYPDAHCELNYRTPLELLIATILSAQSTDKQVNIVTSELFQKYRSASDFAKVHLPELEHDLRSIGLFRNKARNIQSCCRKLVEQFSGKVPETMDELTQLAGVGRKTANVVLGNAFHQNEGVVVDTHVARLSARLGLVKETAPDKIEAELQQLVPREDWTLFSHWLIWHGRRRCLARRPDCAGCEIQQLCPSAGKIDIRTT
jgi:endonuclease III